MKSSMQWLWGQPVILLTLTTLFWAGNTVAGKVAVGEISPSLLTFARWALLSLVLPLLYARQMREVWPVLRGRWLYLAAMGGLGLAAFNLLFYFSAHHTAAVNIGILQGAIPIIVVLGAFALHGTRITGQQVFGVIVGLAGVLTVALRGVPSGLADLSLNSGDVLMASACVLYAGYTLGLKSRPAVPGIVLFCYFSIFGAALSLPFAAAEWWAGSITWPTDTGWLVIAYVTVFPSFLSQIFFLRSVDLIGPGRSGVFVNLTPIFSALLAVALLSEVFRAYHGAALALVLLGLWWARDPGVARRR
ncbi:MAG: DMT family transporter [Arenicellales bacterium]|jgi:drug/metabolite transporter (DMT)-like permease|nr:DMT family transporter [Arenicellales bacterium]HJL56981.1 DMT family transporter [Arenicellales bacterium]|tara:strand:- start:1348 stop:2259 length:912 start_codon:yes stop_codon:yes gene_type:complete